MPPDNTPPPPVTVERISIDGFRSIASIRDLTLSNINVIIGPNGSGKSNFVEIFSLLRAVYDGRLQQYVQRAGGADRLLHFGRKATEQMNIHVAFEENRNAYAISLRSNDQDELVPVEEAGYFWDKKHQKSYKQDAPSNQKEAWVSKHAEGVFGYVRDQMSRWSIYHFHDTSASAPLKNSADVNDNRFLRADGANLAAFLYLLKARYSGAYSLIRRTVQLNTPFFDDFILEPQQLNPSRIRLEWRHKDSDAFFDVSSLSDGTLRFIALATLCLQPTELRPSVILVDEPELGLHPYAINLLAALFEQTAATTQVILATQSPLLLDRFAPEHVLVAERVHAGTQLRRLDPDALADWLEDYSLGELWQKNVLGGRPGRG